MRQITLLLLTLSCIGFAEVKFGYVDMKDTFQKTKEGKALKDRLESEFKKRQTNIEKKRDAIEKKQKEFQKKAMVLSDDERASKQRELQQDMMQAQELIGKSQAEMQDLEQTLSEPIINRIRKAIEVVAKKEQLGAIFQKSDISLLWADDKFDITNKVIKEFEKIK